MCVYFRGHSVYCRCVWDCCTWSRLPKPGAV